MVKIVIAGGSGNIAREVIDVLLSERKHEILVLSRNDTSKLNGSVNTIRVDYTDKESVTNHLRDAHTVLSFITVALDPDNVAQKTLIDASVAAGVKRFAPSEWSSRSDSGIPWYAGKDEVRKYLEHINKDEKVLEYSLFQPGLFINYFSYPHPSTKYMSIAPLHIDFHNRRAIVAGDNGQLSLTTVQDFSRIVAAAIDYDGEWPRTGGIRGGQITLSGLLELGADIRGHPFSVEKVDIKDLEAGVLKTSWIPAFTHPSVPQDQWEAFAKTVTIGSLQAFEQGAWDVSNEWNQRLPRVGLTGIESFLRTVWTDKP